MAKSRKVMDICESGCHLEVIRLTGDRNPYRIKRVSGGHHIQIAQYGDWMSVICFLKDFYMDGVDTMALPEMKDWWKRRCV